VFLTRLFLMSTVVLVAIPGAGDLLDAIASVEDTLGTYLALGASAIAVSELSPIFGGIASLEGQLHLGRVIASITLGGWVATTLLYVGGRLKWDWLRKRFPSTRSAGTIALRIVRRNPWRAAPRRCRGRSTSRCRSPARSPGP
jgi:membrane protein DedA with SNARE-associated domain